MRRPSMSPACPRGSALGLAVAGSALAACAGLAPPPLQGVDPRPGELTIIQLDLPGEPSAILGESALVIGPDGTLVLVDVGSTTHANDVLAAVNDANTRLLTPARGFPPRQVGQVDWLVATHFHWDHVGALHFLFDDGTGLVGLRGLVHRGFVDLGKGIGPPDIFHACDVLRGRRVTREVPLCEAQEQASCAATAWSGDFRRATGCEGLRRGDLSRVDDDDDGDR